jgi:hypothetical protein
VKAMFVQCGGLVLPPLNDVEVPTHILDERTRDMVIETQILQLKENLFGHLKWKGLKFSTHLQITQMVLIDP